MPQPGSQPHQPQYQQPQHYQQPQQYPPQQYQPQYQPPGQAPQQYQPQPHGQQPYGQQPPAPAPGGYYPQQAGGPGYAQPTEGIVVNTQFFALGFMLAFFKPKVFLDGQETPPGGWGRRMVAAQPGRHQVHVHVPYWLPPRIGPADAVADVYAGRFTELEYKAPAWAYSRGSLGIGPQQYNGMGITIAVMVVPLVLFFLWMIIVVATA